MFKLFKKTRTEDIYKGTAKCPICESKISENKDYWVCSGKDCDFKIKNILDGEKIDINLLINMQNLNSYNEMIDCTTKRAKNLFSTYYNKEKK